MDKMITFCKDNLKKKKKKTCDVYANKKKVIFFHSFFKYIQMNTVQRQRPRCSQARMGCGSPLTLLGIGVVGENMFTGLTGRDEKLNIV